MFKGFKWNVKGQKGFVYYNFWEYMKITGNYEVFMYIINKLSGHWGNETVKCNCPDFEVVTLTLVCQNLHVLVLNTWNDKYHLLPNF